MVRAGTINTWSTPRLGLGDVTVGVGVDADVDVDVDVDLNKPSIVLEVDKVEAEATVTIDKNTEVYAEDEYNREDGNYEVIGGVKVKFLLNQLNQRLLQG